MFRPLLQILATARIPLVVGSLWLATSASATPFQGGDCSCRHLEYPDPFESNYVSDTSFARMDSVKVYVTDASPSPSPSPTVRLVANVPGERKQQPRVLTMRIDSTTDAIFASTYAVENILARYYDTKKDSIKARALRAFVARHWGGGQRQMALLCQHHRDDTWSCSDSTRVQRYSGNAVFAMTVFGVVNSKRGPTVRGVPQNAGTDAVLNGSRACKMLEDYYSSNPRFRARRDSLRAAIARFAQGR